MDVLVRGKNCTVPRPVRRQAEEKVERLTRLAKRAQRAEVEFSEQGHHHSPVVTVCEVTLHLPGRIVRAHAEAAEAASSLDLALDKVEHQLARLKGKRVARRRRRRAERPPSAPPVEALLDDELGPDRRGDGSAGDGSAGDGEVWIVREKSFDAKPMSPEEAALQMDLLGHDFFLFSNSENGNAAVIYRRRDGDLGLIETTG